jgi:four helix bundle protein
MREALPGYEGGQDIRDRAFEFACRAADFCKQLYDEGGVARQMAPQVIDCATSLASMPEEARGAESCRDFISKCSISLKETREARTCASGCANVVSSDPWEKRRLLSRKQTSSSLLSARSSTTHGEMLA